MPANPPSGFETTTVAEFNSLADAWGCVDATSSFACFTLFAFATLPGGARPTNALRAAMDSAHNPGMTRSSYLPCRKMGHRYAPALPQAPNAWTIAIKYIGNGSEFEGQSKDGGVRRWKFWPMRPRRPMLPARIDRWSLTSLQQRLVKTGGRLIRQARYYWLLVAEGHLTRGPFAACRGGLVYAQMMGSTRARRVRGLKALAGISWLTARQLEKLADALTVTRHQKWSVIFSDKSSSESAYILLSGVARITCDNRKGRRTMVIMVAPGLIPVFPRAVTGITYNFRCEAVTMCQVGTIGLNRFVKICLGIESAAFKLLATSFLGRWDRVQLRRSNFIGCTLEERLALTLLDLSENFGVPDPRGGMRLTVSVRHGDLAELVGATRPRVTEHLREFTQKHLVSRENRHLVVDREGLKGFLMAAHPDRFSGELQ